MAYFEDIPAQDLSIFNQRAAEAEAPKTGALRKLGDIGVAGARGAVTGVKLLSDAAGAGNPVSESLEGASKWLTGLESPGRAAEKKARAEKIDAAEKSGSTWAEIAANLGGFFEAPVSSTVEALGTSAPTLLTAAIPGVGPAALAARGAATIGMGALQGAGSVKGQIYDTVKAEQLKGGMSPAEAEARALAAQEYFGKNAANIAAGSALGAAAGRFGLEGMLEKSLGGQGLAGGVARRAGTGVVTEGIPEAAQGGQERYASNVALQREGFDTPTFQGVAGNAAAEGIAGGALGGVGGALARPREEPPGIVPPAGLDAPPPIAPSGPLTRAAETAVGAQAGQNAAAAAAGVDPAMRLAELEQKATGTKDQKVPGPDGKPVTVPGTPAQFLTDAEKQERDSLKGSVSEAEVAARNPIAPTSPAAMAAAGPPADPLPAMHQAAADNLAAQKQFGGDRPGIPSTNAVVYQEPKPRDMPPAFEQPVTPGQIFESIEEIRARQQQDGEMLSGLVQPKNEIVPFRGKPPAIDEKTIDGDGLYRVIGEATAAAPDFADHTDLAGRAFAKNPRLTLEVLRDPRIDHEQETVVLRAITRGGNATAQYAKLALEAFQAKPAAAGAQPQVGGSTGVVPEGQEVGAAQPEPLARQEGATGVTEGPTAAPGAAPAGEDVAGQPAAGKQPAGPAVILDPGVAARAIYNATNADPTKDGDTPMDREGAVLTLESLLHSADRGRFKPAMFAQSDIGVRLDSATLMDINKALATDAPGTLRTLLDRANGNAAPAQVESDSTRPLTIEPVSDTTMVIRGSGKHKDAIKAAGGSWNGPQKGWIFPKARETQVRAALGGLVAPAESQPKMGSGEPSGEVGNVDGKKSGATDEPVDATGMPKRDVLKELESGKKVVLNKGTDFEETLWVEESADRKTYVVKSKTTGGTTTIGPAGPDKQWGWGRGDAATRALRGMDEGGARAAAPAVTPTKPPGEAPAAAPRSATGPLTVTENADLGQFTVRDDQGSSMGSFTVKDGKATAIKARAQWAMDDVKAAVDKHAAQLKTAPVATPKTEPAPTKNTIFTDEAYAAAKARMKARMNRLNSGVDPEMLFDGIVMAGHHIERGARTFAAYSKAMIAELGEGIRPYLKSFYMAIKYDPRAAAFAGEMDGEADIDKAGVDAPPAPAQNENSNGDTDVQPDRGAKDQGASQGDQGQGSPDQQGSAPADSEGVADGAPENVGGTPAPGTRKRPGAGGAGGNVGGQRPVRKSRDAADGRDGAGGTGVPDDGAGDGGRVTPTGQRANYHITDPEALIGGGPKARFEHNKKAIEAYQSITSEGREPTQEDLDAMAGYIGWGSFGQELFQGNFAAPAEKPGWVKEGAWLREHLGEAGWKSAQASIINAHYTDPITVEAMWDMVRQLGFKGGRVLEPSMGVGNFFGLMPRDLMAQSSLTGIEMEQTTGGMARILYPEANIQIKPYQDSKTADGFYDLVIGNWPFAKDGPADRRYMNLSPSLHDFFFLKALDQTRPGGLVVGITSAGTMDKKGTVTRAALAGKADLVAAFRLPSGAFEQYAGTSVVTDIIILKRRDTPGDARSSGFLNTVEVETKAGEKIDVNEYFSKNPGNVLGTLNWGHGSTYGRPSMIVERPADLERRLQAIAATLPAVYSPRTTAAKTIQYVTNNTTDRQQAVTLKDGNLYQVQGERLAPLVDVTDYRVKDGAKTAAREAQLGALIEMRRAYGSLIDAEREGAADMEAKRTALREIYDAFVDAHGTIGDSDGLAILKRVRDPFYPSLAALERADGKPAAIMVRSTTRARRRMDNPSVRDAMVLARNEAIDLNMERIAEIAKVTPEAAAKELIEAGAVFRTPVGTYEPSDVYLSGNVRRKIREAQAAADQGEDMARNIEALSKVVPKDIPYFNIEAKFGATWIRPEQYRDFVASLLGIPANESMVVRWTVNRWRVLFTDRALNARPEATTTWGHSSVRFDKLLTSAMGNVAVKVTYKDSDGNLQTDEKASAEANDKAMKIREQFATWLWSDPVRRIEMEQTFNEVMNAVALPKYDGSFLNFDGMAIQRGDSPFNLRKHQVDAIWRGLANGRSINAHEVGTGKTYTMGGLVVESRRYGLAKKPIIFAHNANSASVAREIGEMYPGAKLLYIDNLAPERIATTLRQIANDDWDAIIVPHSLIDRFTLKRETLEEMQREQIDALEQEAIEAAKEDGSSLTVGQMDDEKAMQKVRSVTAKQLVHARNAIIKKIDEMALRSSREDAISFEDMGIDMVVVDEAHEFKKPPITTRMQMKGLNTQSSAQSISMQFLTDYVKKLNGGRGVHTFTGTPITNTMNEIYNQMRFVMDDQMARDGVRDWDAWFNTFADSTSDVELTAAGEYEPVTRLASFVNVAELRRMIGQYMDIVFADDMPEFKPRATDSGKTLADKSLTDAERNQLLNGRSEDPQGRPYKKVITDIAEMTGAQAKILAELQRLSTMFKNASKKDRRDLMLAGHPSSPVIVETNAANAGLDARLYDMSAADDPNAKVNRAATNIMKHYNEHPKATQVVFVERGFSDASVSRKKDRATGTVVTTKKARFNLVRELVEKLVAAGIPEHQIAIVDGSTNKEKRKATADAMNRADIRVVIGNTKTLGVGVNMQTNLRAMHHLDAPWMPGELEQRNGRGHRQGNQWNTVLEYRYLTERIDGRRWQVLAVKDRFIKAFLRADDSVRVIDGDAVSMDEEGDIGSTLADAAGDPRLMLMNKVKGDVTKLETKERMHSQGVFDANRMVKELKKSIEDDTATVAKLESDSTKFRAAVKGDLSVKIGGKTFTDIESANAALLAQVAGLEPGSGGREIGEAWGFTITATLPYRGADVRYAIAGQMTYAMGKPTVESARQTLYGISNRIADVKSRVSASADSIPRMEEASKAPFAREKDLEKKRQMFADLESDIQANPVPAPSWLRSGAPANTEVYIDGKPAVVEGHRWTNEGFLLTVSQGDTTRDIDYTDAKDINGLPVYEAREFAPPKVNASQAAQNAVQQSAQSGAKFSRGTDRPAKGRDGPLRAAKDRVSAQVDRIKATWPNAPEIIVIDSMADAPADVQANDAAQRSGGAKGDPEGFWSAGKVYLVASALETDADVERVLAHEVLGHAGLRGAFGVKVLGDILEQLAAARPADIKAKLEEYGLKNTPAMRLVAAEEVLAELAQTQPDIGFVRRAVAAIRTWLRAHGLGLRLTRDEIIRNYILPARRFAQGKSAAQAPAAGMEPAFSRKKTVEQARETFADMMQSTKAFNWWNKSIGTQYQKAQQNTTFKAVYNRVQDYIQDVSDFGSRAAEQAPTLLPRLDKIRDVLKKPVSAADQKAISAALYGGTLAGESVTDGRLWSDDELREIYKLTDPQISLYREARAAIDQSIDDLGRTEIVKLVGDAVDPMINQQAREAGSMADASIILQSGLDEKIDEARQVDSEEAERKVAHLRSLRRAVRAQTKRVAELKDAGYMPLMRFGKYAVNVPNPDNPEESLHFALFDSERLANAHARELRADPQFADKQITQGIISDRAAQLMQGIDPATLEIFAEAIGASESEVFQEYLKMVTSQRSAMKRLIERKGTPGYSEDVKRTLASFITSNARAASGNLHLRDLLLNTSKIKEGDVKDEAIGLVKHILDPQPDPSAKARSLLFMQFIGGSVASALVNLTQPVTMTLPYLSQYSSPGHAANLLRKATMAAVRGVTGAEADALKRAERDGIVSPQEIHFLYGEAEKAFGSNPLLQRAGFLWGAPFGLAEQFNRRATFIAAYRLGVERNEANPFAFAEKAVIETQGVYNRGNASNWARNPVGGALLTFKQFSVAYLELLKRLPNRERAIALAILALASGMEGLPGADDLDDILDTFAQAFGYNWSSKQAKREFITATLGPEMAQFTTRGVSAFLPMDISARMGLGNLLPGTGLLMQSRQDKGREVAEVFGAPGGAVQMVGKAATQAMAGEPIGAVSAVLPVALQNLLDPNRGALAMATAGQYKDDRGRRVVDVDALDALMKAAGFNPVNVAEPQMAMRIAKQSIDLARAVESEIAGDLAAARVESDSTRAASARARLADWNAKNPDTPIRIEESQIRRRAREMQTTKADRLTRTAPREMRDDIRDLSRKIDKLIEARGQR